MHGTRPHKGVAKRVKITKNGHVKYTKAGLGHRKNKHSAKQNLRLRKSSIAPEVERKRVQRMLGFKIRRPAAAPVTPAAPEGGENKE